MTWICGHLSAITAQVGPPGRKKGRTKVREERKVDGRQDGPT